MISLKDIKQKIRTHSSLVVFVLALVVTVFSTIYFSSRPEFALLVEWAEENFIRFNIFLLLIKIIGIVWPPLPGVVFTLGAISVIGWVPAFVVDTAGNIIGSAIAFGLARMYGSKIIVFLFGPNGEKQLNRFKINPKRELEALTLILIFGGSLSEVASYGAGVTKAKFSNFLVATIISNIVLGLPLFYLFELALSGANFLVGVIPLMIGALFFFFLRDRYFIVDKKTG